MSGGASTSYSGNPSPAKNVRRHCPFCSIAHRHFGLWPRMINQDNMAFLPPNPWNVLSMSIEGSGLALYGLGIHRMHFGRERGIVTARRVFDVKIHDADALPARPRGRHKSWKSAMGISRRRIAGSLADIRKGERNSAPQAAAVSEVEGTWR